MRSNANSRRFAGPAATPPAPAWSCTTPTPPTRCPNSTVSVDLVVGNPPYLPDAHRELVDPEVRDHDPDAALWGGPDGLRGPRMIEAAARRLLRDGGLVAVEHADDQGQAVAEIFRSGRGLVARRRPAGSSGSRPVRHGATRAATSGGASRPGDPLRLRRRRAACDRRPRGCLRDPPRRPHRAADRHGLRHRRRRVHAVGRHQAARGEGPRPRHAGAGADRLAGGARRSGRRRCPSRPAISSRCCGPGR